MVIACPNCGAPYREDEGDCLCVEVLEEYTDGHLDTDIPDESIDFLDCPACQALARLSDARLAGERLDLPWYRKLFLRGAPSSPPEKYIEAIAAGLAESIEDEIQLRLEAWRRSNDPFRRLADHRKPRPEDRPAWWRENLRVLERLIAPDCAGNLLLLAELARELGDFDECLRRVAACEQNSRASESFGQMFRNAEECVDPSLSNTVKHLALENNPFVQVAR